MTFDDIVHALRTASEPPEEALRAGVSHADKLAPLVYDRLNAFCRGTCLLPEDDNLLFFGLHVLAAARHPELWARLVTLARAPAEEIAELFADHAPTSLAQLMLSAWQGDADEILRLIEHADMGEDAKWALFDVLARLTFDGRIARATTCEFLERYESDGLADDDSGLWWGWETAVTRLGLSALEPALARVLAKPAYRHHSDEDKADALAALRAAVAAPNDPEPFVEADIVPVDDPVASLAWVNLRAALHAKWAAEAGPPPDHVAQDPARHLSLSADDEAWLARFLNSRQVPPSAMTLPMLDGYLTAIAIGPAAVPTARYLPPIWAEDATAPEPDWADEAQRSYVIGLIERWHDAIVARRDAEALHIPAISTEHGMVQEAGAWAEGFAMGMELHSEKWNPLFEDVRGAEDGLAILALCEGETEFLGRPASPVEKRQIVERLPRLLRQIATYWRDPGKGYPKSVPLRVQKIGRNDPCPCGSGLKFKKCCALKPPTSLH